MHVSPKRCCEPVDIYTCIFVFVQAKLWNWPGLRSSCPLSDGQAQRCFTFPGSSCLDLDRRASPHPQVTWRKIDGSSVGFQVSFSQKIVSHHLKNKQLGWSLLAVLSRKWLLLFLEKHQVTAPAFDINSVDLISRASFSPAQRIHYLAQRGWPG